MQTRLIDAIIDQFADGEWHSIHEVTAKCGHLIPPERAIKRFYLSSKYQGNPSLYADTEMDEKVDYGRRVIIRTSLTRNRHVQMQHAHNHRDWPMFMIPVGTHKPGHGGNVCGNSYFSGPRRNASKIPMILQEWVDDPDKNRETLRRLAEKYQMALESIYNIVTRRTWKNVPWPSPTS